MKTLINKANPEIRITAPEITTAHPPVSNEGYVYWIPAINQMYNPIDWTFVEEEKADLEKEIDNYMDGYFSECQDGTLLNEGGSELQYEDVSKIAKYFYELGQCKSEFTIAATEEELKKAMKERYPMPENADALTRYRIAAARNGFLSGYSWELGRKGR